MTDITVTFALAQEQITTGTIGVGGAIRARPTNRRVLGDKVILPNPISVSLLVDKPAPTAVMTQDDGNTWAWEFLEIVEGGRQTWTTLTLSDVSGDTAIYSDLTPVDPATFEPLPDVATVGDAIQAEADVRANADVGLSDRIDAIPTVDPSDFATAAQGGKADSAVQPAALETKADLVGGVVQTSQIPGVALTTGQAVANRAAMLALTNVQAGDIVSVTEGTDKGTYVLGSGSSGTFSSWLPLSSPTDVVTSVNGQQGTVVLGGSDVGLGAVDNTADADKPTSTATETALAKKLDGVILAVSASVPIGTASGTLVVRV